ncbi:peptidoglycan DD-metalloendopeptidase family protein [Desulfonatronovibrio magnus]|uniref:peptidoglycan DD-metalloendopeptidase family protein n=1 Tax=Desulfonatronovibrio magnus TaxID=698827 RepID=UPI0005EB53CC|nr:peptidoglycan DD-metalloendopeptidase family protein [Desulfonatronovibrio magnus]
MSQMLSNNAISQLEHSREANRHLEMQKLQERLGAGGDQKKELREACLQFEAIFIQRMWEQMRATVPREGYLHSKEQEMFESMFDQEMSMEMAQAGGIGLADLMYGQLKERLENSGAQAAADSAVSMRSLPSRQNLPASGPGDAQAEEKAGLNSDEINKILNMNLPPEQRMEYLASQIEYTLGGKPLNDLPELDDKVEEIESLPEQNAQDLPPLNWPVSGRVTSDFGWRDDPFTGRQTWHAGMDFAVPEGTPVEACWPGEVVFSDSRGGFGNKIIIQHADGWKSVYAHNSDNLVQVGDKVDSGQKIALSGNTGRSTGPHLHFELRQGDLAWDPRMIEERLLAGLSIGRESDTEKA